MLSTKALTPSLSMWLWPTLFRGCCLKVWDSSRSSRRLSMPARRSCSLERVNDLGQSSSTRREGAESRAARQSSVQTGELVVSVTSSRSGLQGTRLSDVSGMVAASSISHD